MLIIVDALLSLMVAVGVGLTLYAGFRSSGPRTRHGLLILALFLFIWATGVWMTPVGPKIAGVSWVPFVVAGLVVILLLIALTPVPRHPPMTSREALERKKEEVQIEETYGKLFWLLLILLGALIILRYVMIAG